MRILLIFIALITFTLSAQQIVDGQNKLLSIEVVYFDFNGKTLSRNSNNPLKASIGQFPVVVSISAFDFKSYKDTLYSFDNSQSITLEYLDAVELTGVEVIDQFEEDYSKDIIHDVNDMILAPGQKTEAIKPSKVKGNATNYRSMLSGFSGLNIWESDANGLQMDIGGRGLSPSRSANFNTRQNYYDIAADALGYPESYYTPAMDGVDRMELLRGASALQFGTQFGGMINFKMKDGAEETPLQVRSKNTYGSFNSFTSFNSLGGQIKKNFNYYTYYQYKRGDGFRAHSAFESHQAYIKLKYQINENWYISTDYSHLSYLTQQAGGLTDRMFEANPDSVRRFRNWFNINWNVLGIRLHHDINQHEQIDINTFGLLASRAALGNLERIDRKDHDQERNYIQGNYLNYGTEVKYMNKYQWDSAGHFMGVFLAGARLYQGKTQSRQGFGDASAEPNFTFLEDRLYTSNNFTYPSRNVAFFAENIFYLFKKFSVTPGFRYDYIETNADGLYTNIIYHPTNPNLVLDSTVNAVEKIHKSRSVYLLGVALSYRPNEMVELYGNINQNYRAITFNDMRVVNPNFQIDPNLKDENGWTSDIGIRGKWGKFLHYDVNAFMILYNDRIGQALVVDQNNSIYRLRTNIGASRSLGAEASLQWAWNSLWKNKNWKFKQNINYAYNNATYLGGSENIYAGNKVELVPEHTIRTGLELSYKKTGVSVNFNYLTEQYSDATNALKTSSGIEGIIPSYYVVDLSVFTSYKWFNFEGGVNNVLNQRYFTRRATGYPGPGIIPSAPMNFYLSIDFKIDVIKKK